MAQENRKHQDREDGQTDSRKKEARAQHMYIHVFVPYTELLITNCLCQVGKPTKRLSARTLCQGFLLFVELPEEEENIIIIVGLSAEFKEQHYLYNLYLHDEGLSAR